MFTGKQEYERQQMWSQRWVLGTLFGGKVSNAEVQSFIQYGVASSGEPERIGAHVWERVAEIQRTGKVVFE